ncbi:MAG: M28 family peptidase [Thermodesulfovibrionales bacterium]
MEVKENLKRIVRFISNEIGTRSFYQIDELDKTAKFIELEFDRCGYEVFEQRFQFEGNEYRNIVVEVKGKKYPNKVLVIGAHYDTVAGTPGADDNASGIAGLIELARLFRKKTLDKTVRFVAFTLEEPPFFRSDDMGSYRYAKDLRKKGEDVEVMVSLEMIGYFSDKPKSQYFPATFFKWFYPDTGNFIMLVGNRDSKDVLGRIKDAFKKGTGLPVESMSSYSIVPGVDFSDHWSFYQFDYKAIMVTDTAFYRNPNYHRLGDGPDTLDYARMAEVVNGLASALGELATGE